MKVTEAKAFGKVAVLLGGDSAEREVSLRSGGAVLAALQRQGVDAHAFDPSELPLEALKGYDRAFIILHGRGGEDGTLQGALELMGVPYTGSGVMASSISMDKWRTKLVWQGAGLPTARYVVLNDSTDFAAVVEALGLPIFVKPATEGSSIGISKVKTAEQLEPAYREAAKYDSLVIAEQFVAGSEVQFPILGDEVLPSIRIETPAEFYDYQAKYFRDDTRYTCPGLDDAAEQALHGLVRRAFEVLGCQGWGRVDMIITPQGEPYFIEMNTVPGMTDHSLVPMSARVAGIDFDALVWKILEQTVTDHGE